MALFPEREDVVFNTGLLESCPNRIAELLPEAARYSHVIRVLDVSGVELNLFSDISTQRLVCFFR
jgi:hypothetical protein